MVILLLVIWLFMWLVIKLMMGFFVSSSFSSNQNLVFMEIIALIYQADGKPKILNFFF